MWLRFQTLFIFKCSVLFCVLGCRSYREHESAISKLNPLSYVTTYDDIEENQTAQELNGSPSLVEEAGEPVSEIIEPELHLVSLAEPEDIPLPEPDPPESIVSLDSVINSVYSTYPQLRAAFYKRNIAQGEYLSAQGNFDTKLKGATMNGPLGYYQTYRQSLGFDQPTYWGGSVFGGYRVGRGNFQPWYLERQTNGGGEFAAGVSIPLWRNRQIDERRAELWSTAWGTHLAEPQIQQELIEFVFLASDAYWTWVAAGQIYQIQQQLLDLAVVRNKGIEREVDLGARDPPDLEDNHRLIVSREAKVISAHQKFQQASYKLSIFLRDIQGEPIVLSETQIPVFPELGQVPSLSLENDIQVALGNRPELQEIEFQRKQLQIENNLAHNDALPNVDAILYSSKDIGSPQKANKTPFELEAGVQVEVPLQRRKAFGKQQALGGKLSQLALKRSLLEDKIVVELQNVHTALSATYETVQKAREAVRLARYMADVERQKFEAGASDLLSLNLREQQAAAAAETEVEALLEYFRAEAAYRAVLARDHQNRMSK